MRLKVYYLREISQIYNAYSLELGVMNKIPAPVLEFPRHFVLSGHNVGFDFCYWEKFINRLAMAETDL